MSLIDHPPGRPAAEARLAGYTGYLARLAAQRAAAHVQSALPPGRTARDLAILCVLAEGPVSQSRLGAVLEVNRTVMIAVIDGLESARLVRRERDPADRRRYALRLTPGGGVALRQMLQSADEAEQAVTAGLGRTGTRRLAELLTLIVPDLTRALPETVTGRGFFLLDYAAARLRRLREQAMRRIGLEPRCVGMLVALDSAQPCTQERLAGCIGVTGPTIVTAIDEMHSAGLIHRDRNPADRRAHVLRLTPDGEEYLMTALRAEDSTQAELAAALGAAEVTQLNALLSAILAG